MSAFVARQVKQLPFEIRTVDLGVAANLAPAYAGVSVTRRVPTLVAHPAMRGWLAFERPPL